MSRPTALPVVHITPVPIHTGPDSPSRSLLHSGRPSQAARCHSNPRDSSPRAPAGPPGSVSSRYAVFQSGGTFPESQVRRDAEPRHCNAGSVQVSAWSRRSGKCWGAAEHTQLAEGEAGGIWREFGRTERREEWGNEIAGNEPSE